MIDIKNQLLYNAGIMRVALTAGAVLFSLTSNAAVPQSCGTSGTIQERIENCKINFPFEESKRPLKPYVLVKHAKSNRAEDAEAIYQVVYKNIETNEFWSLHYSTLKDTAHFWHNTFVYSQAAAFCETLKDDVARAENMSWQLPSKEDWKNAMRGRSREEYDFPDLNGEYSLPPLGPELKLNYGLIVDAMIEKLPVNDLYVEIGLWTLNSPYDYHQEFSTIVYPWRYLGWRGGDLQYKDLPTFRGVRGQETTATFLCRMTTAVQGANLSPAN